MEKYIMALDQGTTSSRCILFDHEGNIRSESQRESTQIFPQPGWVEHDPKEIWNSQLDVIREAVAKIGVTMSEITAIGITNQRETTVVWDKATGEPVYNAIVWQCRRTAGMIEELKADGFDKYIREKTGLIADAYFSATKIKWILENVEGTRERAEKGELLFGTIDTWLLWNLTGGETFFTDYTNASRTMLFDIQNLCWDKTILNKLNIPECMLPQVKPSSGLFGMTDEKITDVPVPVSGIAGDQQAALFGQCCFRPGSVKNTYGTGCFLLMNTGRKIIQSEHGLISTIAASLGPEVEYALEGSVFVAGAAIQWLRDEMGLIESSSESEKLALKVKDTNGVYVVPSFTGMGAPYWVQNARGAIFGISRGATKAHIVRATLESLAYQTYDVLKAMELDSGIDLKELKVDGGACANNFLMQFQADILGCGVLRPRIIETTALGAAYLAGLASGYWKDREELLKNQVVDSCFTAHMPREEAEKKLFGWNRAVASAISWAFENE
ncbi:glycerol kinase GlpK [Parasporobacterium paucivorans]|uniref:Glycerol kinase n=1 Tax=Parasporobacterium paucivorans DSM 15970 TaxID=1122934 RepID=A0A1M6BG08_9FIRM|nr:glycerol kinase GlpK [Parasporobacterium paucivorans]SHI47528.1 glycerol kinase [Parasporobacterium paucivorans DSM 15970]